MMKNFVQVMAGVTFTTASFVYSYASVPNTPILSDRALDDLAIIQAYSIPHFILSKTSPYKRETIRQSIILIGIEKSSELKFSLPLRKKFKN
jgi:hypothetical protein